MPPRPSPPGPYLPPAPSCPRTLPLGPVSWCLACCGSVTNMQRGWTPGVPVLVGGFPPRPLLSSLGLSSVPTPGASSASCRQNQSLHLITSLKAHLPHNPAGVSMDFGGHCSVRGTWTPSSAPQPWWPPICAPCTLWAYMGTVLCGQACTKELLCSPLQPVSRSAPCVLQGGLMYLSFIPRF